MPDKALGPFTAAEKRHCSGEFEGRSHVERTWEISFSCHAADVGIWKVHLSTHFSLHTSHSNAKGSLLGSPLHVCSGTVSSRCTKKSLWGSQTSAVLRQGSPRENSLWRERPLPWSSYISIAALHKPYSGHVSSLGQIFRFRDLLVILTHSNSSWHFTFQIEGNTQVVVFPSLHSNTNSDKILAGRNTVTHFMSFSGWHESAWVTGLWDSSSKNRAGSLWNVQMTWHQVDRDHICLKFKFQCPSILRHGHN